MTTASTPAPSVSQGPRLADQIVGQVTLHDVPWAVYEQLLEVVGDGPQRLTYDRGSLEIELPSIPHEHVKKLLSTLVDFYAFALGIKVLALGSATWRRRVIGGGLEADECYYIANYDRVADHLNSLDLDVDPPPDLAVEVDITSHSVSKESVYARLGVPEIWRWADDELTCLVRQTNGEYAAVQTSPSFADLSLTVAGGFIQRRAEEDYARLVNELRQWCLNQGTGKSP